MQEAVLGATLEVPTIKGKVRLTIPPNSGTGTRLRLRGRGIHAGPPVRAAARLVLPPDEEPELAEFLRDLEAAAAVQSARRPGGRCMMQITAVVALFADLPEVELTGWIERGWVLPDSAEIPAGCSTRSTSPACG